MFSVIDGDIRIFGVFDGHGIYGHLVSGFAAGHMLDYIRNKDNTFSSARLAKASEPEIKRALRRCFRYT